jgi:hypothetical protein
MAQHVALAEATQPVGREGRVMRDLVFEVATSDTLGAAQLLG